MDWARTEKLAKLLLQTLQDGAARNNNPTNREETQMNDQTPEIPPIPDQTQTDDSNAPAQPSDVPATPDHTQTDGGEAPPQPGDVSPTLDQTQPTTTAPDVPPASDHTNQDTATVSGKATVTDDPDRSGTLAVLHDAAQLAQFLSENPDVLKLMNALVDAARPSTPRTS